MITNKAFFKRNEARIGAEFLLKKALFVIINLSQNPHHLCVYLGFYAAYAALI